MKNKTKNVDKNTLTKQDIENGIKTFKHHEKPHAAFKTPDGKRNRYETCGF
jgi:hypothetical protein